MSSQVLSVNSVEPAAAAVAEGAVCIRNGGVIVYPTETLYGLGADALNLSAVRRVQRIKRREVEKPILVLVDSIEMLGRVVRNIPCYAEALIDRYWPGPLTLVLEALPTLPQGLTRGTGSVGVRIPSSPVCHKLLQFVAGPITSTSANLSGQPVGSSVEAIRRALGDEVDLYLDAGELPASKPSTVVDVTGPSPRVIREGVISFDEIQRIVSNAHR